MLKDLNGDGKVNPGKNTADDPGDRMVIGNTTPRYTLRDQPRRQLRQRLPLQLPPGRRQAGLVPESGVERLLGAVQPPVRPRAQLAPQGGDDLVGGEPELLPSALRVAALQQRRRHPAPGAVEVRDGRVVPPAEEPAGRIRAPHALRVASRREGHSALRHGREPLDLVAALQVRGQHRRRERDRTLGPAFVGNRMARSAGGFSDNSGDGYNYPMLRSFNIGATVTF